MNTPRKEAVTGEGNVPRVTWPTFDDIQGMAGFPVDREGYATADDAEAGEDRRYIQDEARDIVLRNEEGEAYAD